MEMTDIVEQLQQPCTSNECHRLRRWGAEEIERLRADNHKLMMWNEQLQAKIDALEDETPWP
jgi:hypothetical protein